MDGLIDSKRFLVKRFFHLVLLWACLGLPFLIPTGQAATITGNLLNITGSAHPDKKIVFTPVDTPRHRADGSVLWTPTQVTSVSGAFSVVLGPGHYRVSIDGITWAYRCIPDSSSTYTFNSSDIACHSGTGLYLSTNMLYKVITDDEDLTPNYLAAKLAAGAGIALENADDGSGTNKVVTISVDGELGDHKVLANGLDETAGYLIEELLAGTGMSIASAGGDNQTLLVGVNEDTDWTWTGTHTFTGPPLFIGEFSEGIYGAVDGEAIISIRDVEQGDTDYNLLTLQVRDGDNQSKVTAELDSLGAGFRLEKLTLAGVKSLALNNNATLAINAVNGGRALFSLSPDQAAHLPPYVFNSGVAHTSGNLLEIQNLDTNKALVWYDGAISIQGQTNRIGDNGSAITYNGTALGSGSVASVAMTGDNVVFNSSVSGSPITTSGTLAPSLKTQSANTVFAGPTSGGAATPTFRILQADDIPNLGSYYLPITGGTLSGRVNWSGTSHPGLTLNNLSTAQRDALTGANTNAGSIIWNTTQSRLNVHNGSAWSDGFVRLAGDTMTGALILPSSAGALGFSTDVLLQRDAANTLALRNGANAQALRVYTTYTDASNYRMLSISGNGDGASNPGISAVAAGTGGTPNLVFGAPGSVEFWTASTKRWLINSSGHLLAGADNTYNIGAPGASRPANVYVAGTGTFGAVAVTGNVTANTGGTTAAFNDIQAGAARFVYWNTRSQIASPADGVLLLQNNAASDFGRLQFGGTSASFPALKRSSTDLEAVLADNTVGAAVGASTFRGLNASGTDVAGTNIVLQGGLNTGTAKGGAVIIKTGNSAGTSGSSAGTASERFHAAAKFVNLTDATATTIFTIPVAATNYVGLTATITIYATDGTDHQSKSSVVTVDAIAKTTTITPTLTQVDNTTAASAGTLTCTYTAVDNGSNVLAVKANATSSLTETVLRAKVVITAINSNGDATVTEL